jgi:hypothetical protein
VSMLTLNGRVANVYASAQSTDRVTGEVRESKPRVQIMAENTLQNGQKRLELVNLTVDDPEPYRKLQNRAVRVPVGVFATSSGVQFYALKGGKPEPLLANAA